MEQVRAGFVIAISSARELLRLWLPYWHVIKPWSYTYIILSLVYRYRYPQGSQSMLFEFLWQGLFFGLSLLMAWNWGNALVGKSGRLDLQNGWNDGDWKDYFTSMLMALLAMPMLLAIAISVPMAMVLVLLYGEAALNSATSSMAVVSGFILYFFARMLPISATLIARQPTPLPAVWQATQRHQFMVLGSVLTVLVVHLTLALLVTKLAVTLENSGVTRADLLALPLAILSYLFVWGWYILLSQRLFAILQVGSHGRS